MRIVAFVGVALFALGKLLEWFGVSTPMIVSALVAACVIAFLSMVRIVNSSRAAEAKKTNQAQSADDASAESKKTS